MTYSRDKKITLMTAFSRDQVSKLKRPNANRFNTYWKKHKVYVQNVMEDNGALVYDWITNRECCVILSG